nr:uncharacterized protein [Tanacetum cinerariifolium]
MLDRYSSVAQSFRMARDWCNIHSLADFRLRLHSEWKTTRQYNAPTVSEVASIIINDFGDAHPTLDIIVDRKDTGLQRMSELHPSYMALQYPLLFSGCLFQQYLVDAYTAVEEQRLKWTRNNQDTLRVDLYHNLCDAVTRGDTSEVGLGKRIVLPRTFTGSPRVVYVIEFQKRGLPHAHILLWLEENYKCKTPNEIDDIILADMPSPIADPDGYKMVTNYMLHGPCGKDARNAACTNDGKCSKHFPKPFLVKTFLDEDGYPHYRRRDNKVTFKKGKFMYDNKHVVPHNRYLLLKYKAHINVEPLKLWEETWQTLSEDILGKKPGRTAHNRFVILLELMENSTCGITQNTRLAELMQEGMTMLLGGDFRQVLPVIPQAKRLEVVQSCINKSELWRYCKVFTLTRSMRVNEYSADRGIDTTKQEFNQWVLAVGDGTLPAKMKEGEDEPTWIDISEKFLIKMWECPIQKIVKETYPDFNTRHTNDEYLKERAILTLQNDDADTISEFMFKQLPSESVT